MCTDPAEDDVVHDVLAGVSVHRAERVIQDVDIRVLVHRTRQADTLFLALSPQVICSERCTGASD